MNREFKVYNLFPTPVFQNFIDLEKYNLEELYNTDYELMESENGKLTKDKYILDKEQFKELKKEIMYNLELYTKNFLKVDDTHLEWYLQNSWVNKHEKGDWGQSHFHANSLISGVLYLRTNEKSGNIIFESPTNHRPIFPVSCNLPFSELTIDNCNLYSLEPKNGMIILFPSSLLHGIKANISDMDRYSMAFNFHIEGELLSKKSQIDYLKIRR